MVFDKIAYAPVIGPFCFSREETGRELSILPVIMKTITAPELL